MLKTSSGFLREAGCAGRSELCAYRQKTSPKIIFLILLTPAFGKCLGGLRIFAVLPALQQPILQAAFAYHLSNLGALRLLRVLLLLVPTYESTLGQILPKSSPCFPDLDLTSIALLVHCADVLQRCMHIKLLPGGEKSWRFEVPKPGCFKVSNLVVCNFYALFSALLRTCVCALLRSFACFCERPHFSLESPENGPFWKTPFPKDPPLFSDYAFVGSTMQTQNNALFDLNTRDQNVSPGLLVAPCGWDFNRGRGRGWESRPLSRFCFAFILKGFWTL